MMPPPSASNDSAQRSDGNRREVLVSVVAYGEEQRSRCFLHAFLAAAGPQRGNLSIIVVDTFERYGPEERDSIRRRWAADALAPVWIDLSPQRSAAGASAAGASAAGASAAGASAAGASAAGARPRLTYIFANENLGFARGHNLAFDMARAAGDIPYFLAITNDVDVETEHAIVRLVEQLERHPDAGVVGPCVVDAENRPQGPFRYQSIRARYWALFVSPVTRLLTGSWFLRDGMAADRLCSVYRLMGCMLLFRGGDFERAGRFDDGTFLYAEESIISERLRRIGRRVLYDPSVRVVHQVGTTIGKHHDDVAALRLRVASDLYYYARYRNVGAVSRGIARAAVAMFVRVYVPVLRRLTRSR